jgi:hypothetical protein
VPNPPLAPPLGVDQLLGALELRVGELAHGQAELAPRAVHDRAATG